MNKTAIKNFAVWARRKLISEITYKAGLIGISEKGILSPLANSTDNVEFYDIGTGKPTEISDIEVKQRNALVAHIKDKENTSDYKTAFQFVVEEVAYTWFNRLVAIRFMEVNEYLPSKIRVLSSEMSGKAEPDMVTTPFDTDMEFNAYETDRIMQLKDENKLDELFRMLFIKQCNKLNEVLPELFEKTSDYTEFLLNISFTDKDGIVSHLVNDISEDDFKEAVEIIGWLYQYYNTEPKEQVFANLKKNIKITKDNIPAATQLFTPDWIVRYMTENSLGRLWLEGHPNDDLKADWKYYLDEAEQEESVKAELEKIRADYKNIKLEEIKLIDPCMGSGHILVYAFDVFMQIYESQGYTQRDAAQSIIQNNIFGLDIDERAYQLSYFAIIMKARKYDRRFLTRGITPQVYCPKGYADGEEYGSLLNVDTLEPKPQEPEELTIFNFDWEKDVNTWNFRRLLNQKYDVVVTNPPYMGSRKGMNPKIKKFVEKNYNDSKSDLYTAFIEKSIFLTKTNGMCSLVTQQSFMFTDDYKELRIKMLSQNHFVNMIHLGADAFPEINGEVVQTTAFVIRAKNVISKYKATFSRLVDFSCNEKEREMSSERNIFLCSNEEFKNIKAIPFSYWLSDQMRKSFDIGNPFEKYGNPRQGLATGENDRFMRNWFEVNFNKIGFGYDSVESFHNSGKLYIPYNKGGKQIRWYGNNDYVLMFDEINYTILSNQGNHLPSRQYYCQKCMTWSDISGRSFAARYCDKGTIFDVKGSCGFPNENNFWLSLAFLNCKLTPKYIDSLNPTTTTQVGDLKRIPVIPPKEGLHNKINILSKDCVEISKYLYDVSETSWDFVRHPLLDFMIEDEREALIGKYNENGAYIDTTTEVYLSIENAFINWERYCKTQFNQLKANEEELNRIFIDIYGLQDELTPQVEDKDVTVRKADLTRDIKSFISYAVGCMFGRYSLDVDGLAYAGGDWNDSKYKTFIPDTDNVIPITDEEYFEDDIVGLFVAFVKKVYGVETLEENLDFIAKALGNKGNTAREVIRNYFVKDFYKDHVKTYQKRPIYWLYDSGKADGFKALIYMHRYTADTTGLVRVDYLHKMQRTYMSEIDRMQDEIENGKTSADISKAEKRKEKLIKQLKETKEYDEKIAHLALSRIAIDLDDGVKVNYDKVQTAQDGKMLNVLGKI